MTDLSIRLAKEDDSHEIWEWRNDEQTRKMSLTHDEISLTNHQTWYTKALADKNKCMYIISNQTEKVGVVRFDHSNDNTHLISINLNPKVRGKGYGSKTLNLAVNTFKLKNTEVKIIAEIDYKNMTSRHIFEKNGFTTQNPDEKIIHYTLA